MGRQGTGGTGPNTGLRTQKLTLRLTPAEAAAVRERAADAGFAEVAAYARQWIITQEAPRPLLVPAGNLDLYDTLAEHAAYLKKASASVNDLTAHVVAAAKLDPAGAEQRGLRALFDILCEIRLMLPGHTQAIQELQVALMRPASGLDEIRSMLVALLEAVLPGQGEGERG